MRSLIYFFGIGGITTFVHVVIGLIAHHGAGLAPFNANLVAFCFGFFMSYFGHRTYTFRSPGRMSRSMPRFFVIAAASLALNQIIVHGVVTMLGHPYWLALAVMVAIVPAFTYLLGRLWAFNDGEF